ncbi:MAG: 23S rRNA pseudouridine(955/2504/2580) synthase [Candidatus Contendobacter odensis]|uniref:Pseudouridine synthase n=1 Tax=Candidatus Contendibacter odensensis TaxID=1400860 RepID=A0A2G6PFQ0_9GAMM|nr:MAG: 23S rRNA pseudouridine(955/2504/2580) synthase [Candidatus Contendobacter odensis]
MNTLQLVPVTTSTNGVRYLEIAPEYAGQRIDNFLLRELKGVPKNFIYRILRSGEVRLNGGRVRSGTRIQAGDKVRIPPVRLAAPKEDASRPPPHEWVERLRQAVLYEDHDVLILNKPAGLAVHKGSGIGYGVIEILRVLRSKEPFLELAHRLDRETSGCLALAKSPAALRLMQQAFRTRQVEKRYLALVRGYWNYGCHEVNQALRRNILRSGERMVQVADHGRVAQTHFRPINMFRLASLLEARIATGRTHQVRVHAACMNHPLAGDEKYGDTVFNRKMVKHCGLRRLFLHAHSLGLPLGGREIIIDAPLDAELKAVLVALGSGHRKQG